MKIAIRVSIVLQLWLVLTNLLAITVSIERGYDYLSHLDEALLLILSTLKILLGPVAIILLLTKKEKGTNMTIALFIIYIVGTIAMPILDKNPMAWWHNTLHMGQGPLYGVLYLCLAVYMWKNLNKLSDNDKRY